MTSCQSLIVTTLGGTPGVHQHTHLAEGKLRPSEVHQARGPTLNSEQGGKAQTLFSPSLVGMLRVSLRVGGL